MVSVREAHQVQRLAVDLILFIQDMVESHDFEDARHRLIIQSLTINHVLNSSIQLFETEENLLNILQVAIVFPAEALEFLL